MGNQNNGGNGNGVTGSEKQNGFFSKVKKAAKNVYVRVTTSKAGKFIGLGVVAGLGALGAKKAYDEGFKKGAASVTPTTVYITAGVDDDDDEVEQEPEEEQPVEETAE